MKKTLFSTIALCATLCGSLYADPYAQVTNYCCQVIATNGIVNFENSKLHHIQLVNSEEELEFDSNGTYLIQFTAVGAPFNSNPVSGQWSLSLQKNGVDIDQGHVSVQNGSCEDRAIASWDVIVDIADHTNDRIRLVVTTSSQPNTLIHSVNMVATRIDH